MQKQINDTTVGIVVDQTIKVGTVVKSGTDICLVTDICYGIVYYTTEDGSQNRCFKTSGLKPVLIPVQKTGLLNMILEYVIYSKDQRAELSARRKYQSKQINMLGYLQIVRDCYYPKKVLGSNPWSD